MVYVLDDAAPKGGGYYTLRQVSEICGVTFRTAIRWTEYGKRPHKGRPPRYLPVVRHGDSADRAVTHFALCEFLSVPFNTIFEIDGQAVFPTAKPRRIRRFPVCPETHTPRLGQTSSAIRYELSRRAKKSRQNAGKGPS